MNTFSWWRELNCKYNSKRKDTKTPIQENDKKVKENARDKWDRKCEKIIILETTFSSSTIPVQLFLHNFLHASNIQK